MNSKQLANVLVKILGLSFAAHGAMQVASDLVDVALTRNRGPLSYLWANFFGGAIWVVVGIGFILKSRNIAEWMFKGEGE